MHVVHRLNACETSRHKIHAHTTNQKVPSFARLGETWLPDRADEPEHGPQGAALGLTGNLGRRLETFENGCSSF